MNKMTIHNATGLTIERTFQNKPHTHVLTLTVNQHCGPTGWKNCTELVIFSDKPLELMEGSE